MVKVMSSGLYSTIQDLGRFGYRDQGVPVSGVMDQVAATNANLLVGNDQDMAVLECTAQGPTVQFHKSVYIALVGGDFDILLNDQPLLTHQAVRVEEGDVLVIGRARSGMRCYLAVSGGFTTPSVLNSRSFCKGITPEHTLAKGMVLPIGEKVSELPAQPSTLPLQEVGRTLNGYKGPEYDAIMDRLAGRLTNNSFTIAPQSNRLAYILEGLPPLSLPEMNTVPVQPGTVQLTPSGKLMVLMRDAQVTGGYPRIFQLTERSCNLLAQKRGGEQLTIELEKQL